MGRLTRYRILNARVSDYLTLGIVLLVTTLLIVFGLAFGTWGAREQQRELIGFNKLQMLALGMIESRAPGVSADGQYILTFDAFFDFVAANHPDKVSTRDAP